MSVVSKHAVSHLASEFRGDYSTRKEPCFHQLLNRTVDFTLRLPGGPRSRFWSPSCAGSARVTTLRVATWQRIRYAPFLFRIPAIQPLLDFFWLRLPRWRGPPWARAPPSPLSAPSHYALPLVTFVLLA